MCVFIGVSVVHQQCYEMWESVSLTQKVEQWSRVSREGDGGHGVDCHTHSLLERLLRRGGETCRFAYTHCHHYNAVFLDIYFWKIWKTSGYKTLIKQQPWHYHYIYIYIYIYLNNPEMLYIVTMLNIKNTKPVFFVMGNIPHHSKESEVCELYIFFNVFFYFNVFVS